MIVLTILAMLAGLLVPVFVHAREKGRQASCTSNLRQIGHAFSLYVSDYDGVLPGAVAGLTIESRNQTRGISWTTNLLPYTGGTYLNCSDRELPGAFLNPQNATDAPPVSALTGYAMNYRISEEAPVGKRSGTLRVNGKAETLFHYPACTILVFEARTSILSMNYPDVYPWRSSWSPEARAKWDGLIPQGLSLAWFKAERKAQKGGATRHNGGANYVFADGHVKWLKPELLSASSTNDGVHPGFGL